MNKLIITKQCEDDVDQLFKRAANKYIKDLQKGFEKAFTKVKGYVDNSRIYWKLICELFNDREFVKRITNYDMKKCEERKKKQKELDKKWEELDEMWKKGTVYTEIKVNREKLKQGIFEYVEVPVAYEEVFCK